MSVLPPLALLPSFLLLLLLIGSAKAACPSLSSVPVVSTFSEYRFNCARVYYGEGAATPELACNDCDGVGAFDWSDNEEEDAAPDGYWPMGSIQALPGCTLDGFLEYGYAGAPDAYAGPATFPDVSTGIAGAGCLGDGYLSARCSCVQKFIACLPEEGFVAQASCDATAAAANVTCSYTMLVGTEYSPEATDSLAVSDAVSAAVIERFSGDLGLRLGVSADTGYDWTSVAAEVTSPDVEARTVEFSAAAGTAVELRQVEAECGGNVVHTEQYEVVDVTNSKSSSLGPTRMRRAIRVPVPLD